MSLKLLVDALKQAKKKADGLEFPEFLRACRESLGMQQLYAAGKIGCCVERLSHLEGGKTVEIPKYNEIEGIANLYDLDIDDLYFRAKAYMENQKDEMRAKKAKNELKDDQK